MFTQGCFLPSLVENSPVVLEKIFKSSKCIFTIFQLSPPMRRMWPFIWPNLNPLHQRILRAKFGLNWPSGSGEEDFYKLSIHFWYFPIISPWKRAGPFTWTNLNSNDPRLHCAKFGWNWPCASGEEDFLNFFNLFSLFGNYLLLEKGRALYFSKLESPSPKECFVPSLV